MRFLQPEVVFFPHVAMSVAAISIPFLYLLAKYNKKIGEDINSQAIVGQAKNFTLDVYSSMLVFLGVLSSYLGVPWIEALIAVIISALILKTGASIGKNSVSSHGRRLKARAHQQIKKAVRRGFWSHWRSRYKDQEVRAFLLR
jgi:divalent metal cation (Fe/Co/Zn/Cd) transporter